MAERICIIGTGQMAVMCATLLSDNGHAVTLLGHADSIEHLRRTGESKHLPGVKLPPTARLSTNPDEATHDTTMLVSAVPTQAMRAAFSDIFLGPILFVSCAKGIELGSGLRPSEVAIDMGELFPAVLSGPNIAAEVVRRKPAGAVVACKQPEIAERVRAAFATDYFRLYTNPDVIGVELAGATKNIIALAAGIIDGLKLGNNAKASLITRGIVEITRLGVSLGAQAETFNGLAGLGDLITTCISPEGRNRTVGERIGRGERLDEILAQLGSVCEGVPTTRAVRDLARRQGVEMPITDAIHAILFEGKEVRAAVLDLMTREAKSEADD